MLRYKKGITLQKIAYKFPEIYFIKKNLLYIKERGTAMSLIPFQDNHVPARRPSEDARQYAYRIIKNCILDLLLIPGQKMNEVDLASTLNVSRTPVHDSFFKLSRENLVDVIPKRGAFVSKIDSQRIEEAVWLHTKLGTSMIQSIYVKNVPESQLRVLHYQVHQLDDYMFQGDLTQAARILTEYYRQLYILAGDMELVWASVQKVDMDLRRLLYLASSSTSEGFLCELTSLADALIKRDYDKACLIYSHHMSRMLLLMTPLKEHNPQYFTKPALTAKERQPG